MGDITVVNGADASLAATYAMGDGTAFVGYNLYTDPAMLSPVIPGSSFSLSPVPTWATANISYPVVIYGQVPAQTSTLPLNQGVYTDTVNVVFQ